MIVSAVKPKQVRLQTGPSPVVEKPTIEGKPNKRRNRSAGVYF